MSERQSGTVAVLLLALALGLVAILGLTCLGAGLFFLNSSAPMPVAPPGTPTGISGFNLNVSGANRLPDGSYNIFVVGSITGFGEIGQIQIEDVRLTDVPNGECTVKLPPGPPYAQTLDFVVHTRPLPPEQKSVQLSFNAAIEGAMNTFSMAHSKTMTVDLLPASKQGPDKTDTKAEAESADFPLKPVGQEAGKAPSE